MPTISDLRRICKHDGLDRAVLVYVRRGHIGYVSYGKDQTTCLDTRKLADALYAEAIRTYGETWGP